MTNPNSTNGPVAQFADGTIKIAIFRNEPTGESDRVRFSGRLTRSYRDTSGEWHETNYLSGTEYLRAANLLIQAYNRELALKKEAKVEQEVSE